MQIDIFTLFPEMIDCYLRESILKRAVDRALVEINLHNIRDFGAGNHRSVDDTPYGGGAGMVMAAPPIFDAIEQRLGERLQETPVIFMSPAGEPFTHSIAQELSGEPGLALLCGRYEGVDQRVRDHLVTREISTGDYVLSGGELAAMILVDAVARLIPGVIEPASLVDESFSQGLLEYPQYTRPAEYRGWQVPGVLLSGDHGRIAEWRHEQSLAITRRRRPDLLDSD